MLDNFMLLQGKAKLQTATKDELQLNEIGQNYVHNIHCICGLLGTVHHFIGT